MAAPVWKRIAAGIYDLLVVIALWFGTAAAALAMTRGNLDSAHPAFRVALLAVLLSYFALSWLRGGQSIGARAWRLRVETSTGDLLKARQAWVRAVIMCVGALPLGLGTMIAWFDPARRSVQDRLSDSRVVRWP